MGERPHPDVSEHVPTKDVSDRLTVAKRAGVGRGIWFILGEKHAVEASGNAWDAFCATFFGTLSATGPSDWEDNPEKEYSVDYDFVNQHFLGKELLGIKQFVDEHNLR